MMLFLLNEAHSEIDLVIQHLFILGVVLVLQLVQDRLRFHIWYSIVRWPVSSVIEN